MSATRVLGITAPLVAALTLGLAPFAPQPHVVEKLRWLASGHALRAVDAFDLLLHGAPWLWLLAAVLSRAAQRSVR